MLNSKCWEHDDHFFIITGGFGTSLICIGLVLGRWVFRGSCANRLSIMQSHTLLKFYFKSGPARHNCTLQQFGCSGLSVFFILLSRNSLSRLLCVKMQSSYSPKKSVLVNYFPVEESLNDTWILNTFLIVGLSTTNGRDTSSMEYVSFHQALSILLSAPSDKYLAGSKEATSATAISATEKCGSCYRVIIYMIRISPPNSPSPLLYYPPFCPWH